jgi:Na+-exporting ATPase
MEPTEAVSRDNEGTDGQDFPRSSGDNASDDEVDELDSEDIVQPSDVHGQFEDLVSCAALNNMATLSKRDENKGWEANGDPTEIALQVFAHKAGRGKPHLYVYHIHITEYVLTDICSTHKRKAPRKLERRESRHSDHTHVAHIAGHYEMLVEHPFDSTIKRMSTAWEFVAEDAQDNEPKPISVFLKGAVERVLERCTHIGMGDERIELTQEGRDNIIARMNALAGEGLRVLGLAGKRVSGEERDNITNAKRDSLEVDCGFLGLVGIYDPPREESAGAVADALRAGIAVRMLTGDHAATATSIARSVGILTNDHGPTAVMTGPQFDDLKDSELDALPELPVVVARCSPETKVRMIEALHRRGRKAVMTGDGVNDSPSKQLLFAIPFSSALT